MGRDQCIAPEYARMVVVVVVVVVAEVEAEVVLQNSL